MLQIDGSYGEGGGQVLRTALTLSALTGQAVHLRRIRAGRRQPGLAPQHLTGVLALAQICQARVRGATLRSTELVFEPQTAPVAGEYFFDVADQTEGGSAGAVSLIWQTLWLPLALAGAASRLTLKGGTHVAWSPPFDYLTRVFLPTVAPLGLATQLYLDAWGFYPVGGGVVRVEIPPARLPLQPLTLTERGALRRVWGLGVAAALPAHIAQRLADRAGRQLRDLAVPLAVAPARVRSAGPGAGLFLVAEYAQARAGFSALGEKGKPSEQVADTACAELQAHHAAGAPVDPHLADQLLLPLALAAETGASTFRTSRVTQHLLTNACILEQGLPVKVEIDGQEGETGEVRVKPAGRL